jgi:ribonuclease Z
MEPLRHYLVNGRFRDPGLVVELRHTGEVFLFDLGDITPLPKRTIIRAGRVFISHTHMDHFYGFDYLLRCKMDRPQEVDFYGTAPLDENLYGKLHGYTWNLADEMDPIELRLLQVGNGGLEAYRYTLKNRFSKERAGHRPMQEGILVETPAYRVRCAVLEHRVPVLGFTLEYKARLHLIKERVENLPLRAQEVGKFKAFLENGANRGKTFAVGGESYGYETLLNEYSYWQKGMKISYVTDVGYSQENRRRIVDLVKGSDVLYMEATFLEKDRERAEKYRHLTAKQTGTIAKEAAVKKLVVFHHSKRYITEPESVLEEVRSVFPEAY